MPGRQTEAQTDASQHKSQKTEYDLRWTFVDSLCWQTVKRNCFDLPTNLSFINDISSQLKSMLIRQRKWVANWNTSWVQIKNRRWLASPFGLGFIP